VVEKKQMSIYLIVLFTVRSAFTSYDLQNQYYRKKVCKIYCQVLYTIIQDCYNLCCLDILRINLTPQLIYIMLSLNIFNALTA